MKFSTIIFVATVLLSYACLSAPNGAATHGKKMTPEQREDWKKKTGGVCHGVTKGGCYLFIDCTKRGLVGFDESVTRVSKLFSMVVTGEKQPELLEKPFTVARSVLKGRKDVSAVTVFYEGTADEPIELYSPMERISIVNVKPLQTADGKVETMRVLAMANRSFVFTAGGVMQYGFESVMKNISTVEDLDKLVTKTAHPLSVQAAKLSAEEIGISQHMHGLYRVGCQQGWAPAPTNDYQKAIWDEVHSEMEKGPAKAIRIRPPMPQM